MAADLIDTVVSLCKRRGFVYPSSEIYGGQRAAWDYGPLGVELKENVKRQWWQSVVRERDDVVGVDTSVILAREVWEASGHVSAFVDPLTECTSCHKRFRADHLEEAFEAKHKRAPESLAEVNCPNCGNKGQFTEPKLFNGLLKTHLGPVEDGTGHGVPASGDRAGAVHLVRAGAAGVATKGAVRHRKRRQVVPQRDHARQLHLPHPRVRADGA